MKYLFLISLDSCQLLQSFYKLLEKCCSAIKLEMVFQTILLGGISDGKNETASLFSAEQSLLKLATYNECTNGIMYNMPFLFEEGDNLYLYVR